MAEGLISHSLCRPHSPLDPCAPPAAWHSDSRTQGATLLHLFSWSWDLTFGVTFGSGPGAGAEPKSAAVSICPGAMDLRGALLTASLLLLSKVAAEDSCTSGMFTRGGKCCSLCGPGYGVSSPCGGTDTKCAPCAEGTFSETSSATETCQACSTCEGPSLSVESSCNTMKDTVCQCQDGHFLQNEHFSNQSCVPCQVCSKGHGVTSLCKRTENTRCQPCPTGFYSEEKSSLSPCLPCRTECKETEVQIGDCVPQHDILCMDKDVPILKRADGDSRKDENGTMLDTPQFIAPADDNSKNIIPVYCSILAAVVVGLIGYVAYKCYNTCKQKKQLAKARAVELAASGEGEKLHSDSGVFLDTHSLQDQNQLSKVKTEPKLYINLPPHKQEEVERLLADTSRGKDWQRLANLLGYEEEAIDMFGRGEDPVHTLLTDWSSKDGSTLEVLCATLVNMERADVVENLNSSTDASSVV